MTQKMKGQGAMEYLMTYGWALLVIVVVGAALFALGVLNPTTYTQKRCQGFQYFTYQDQLWTGGAAGRFTIDLVNGPRDIVVDSVNVTSSTQSWPGTLVAGVSPLAGSRFTASTDTTNAPTTGLSYSNVVVLVRYNVTAGIQMALDRGTCSGIFA
jgi:hypothetical protein